MSFPVILNVWKIQTHADVPMGQGKKLEGSRKFQSQLLHFLANILYMSVSFAWNTAVPIPLRMQKVLPSSLL